MLFLICCGIYLGPTTSPDSIGTIVVVVVVIAGGSRGGYSVWVIAGSSRSGPALVESDAKGGFVPAQRSGATTPTTPTATSTHTAPTSTDVVGAHSLLRSLDLFAERQRLGYEGVHTIDRVGRESIV